MHQCKKLAVVVCLWSETESLVGTHNGFFWAIDRLQPTDCIAPDAHSGSLTVFFQGSVSCHPWISVHGAVIGSVECAFPLHNFTHCMHELSFGGPNELVRG